MLLKKSRLLSNVFVAEKGWALLPTCLSFFTVCGVTGNVPLLQKCKTVLEICRYLPFCLMLQRKGFGVTDKYVITKNESVVTEIIWHY